MKKYHFILLLLAIYTASLQAQKGYEFTTICQEEATFVKSQGRTGTCWCFSSASFLESELIRTQNVKYDLSEMFVVRNIYLEKALNYVRRQGKANFSEGSLGHDLINSIQKYGIVPEDVYAGILNEQGQHDHDLLFKELENRVNALVKSKNLDATWQEDYQKLLDQYFGAYPKTFNYNGKEYTPQSYAEELGFSADNFIGITSYQHHPFYTDFVLEIPDNFSNGTYYNMAIDELQTITDEALKNGYTLIWDGDVSEDGFSASNGLAILPEQDLANLSKKEKAVIFESPVKEQEVTQALRQETFDNYSTTDDHLMHIVGLAEDQNGTPYYIIKNSWGEIGERKGYIYMSSAYFRLKTVSVMLNKEGIPQELAQKLGLMN